MTRCTPSAGTGSPTRTTTTGTARPSSSCRAATLDALIPWWAAAPAVPSGPALRRRPWQPQMYRRGRTSAAPGSGTPARSSRGSGCSQIYQRYIYLRGTLLGLIVLIGAAGVLARWRRWGGVGLLPWLVGALLIVLPPMTAGFSYRYVLAAVPAACLAAGLAFARRPGTSQCAPWRPICGGTLAAASLSSRNSVRCLPRAPAAGTCTGPGVGQRHRDRVGLFGARGEDPDLAGGLDRRQGQGQPDRRGLGRAAHRHDRPLVVERGHAGKQRGDVPLGADAEHQHVELGHRAVVLRPGRGGQPRRVPGGRRLRVVAVRPVGSRHGVHPGRVDVHVIEQGRARAGLVPVRVAGRGGTARLPTRCPGAASRWRPWPGRRRARRAPRCRCRRRSAPPTRCRARPPSRPAW